MSAALTALHDHRVGAPCGHLAGVLCGTDGRDHHRAGFLELGDEFLLGCQRERGHFDALADQQLDAVSRVGGVGAHVDSERPVGRGLHLGDRGREFVDGHGGCGQDAQPARVGGGGDQPGSGHPTHPGLNHRMLDTQ